MSLRDPTTIEVHPYFSEAPLLTSSMYLTQKLTSAEEIKSHPDEESHGPSLEKNIIFGNKII